jgi:molecular chaperone HscB
MNLTVLEMGDKKKTLGVHLCWNCQQETGPSPFCDRCLKIQPPGPEMDYFTFMGLSLVPKIDLKALEEIFHNLSRKLHPDFYQDKSEREKALSLENSAVLNRAYRTLRDPVRRAEYLVQLEEGPDAISGNHPPQELLEEILEYHERLEELRGLSPKDEGRREEMAQGLEQVKAQFQRKEADLFQGLEDLFERWDQKEQEARRALLEETKRLLSKRNYIRNVIRDIEDALTPEEASA